MKSHRFWCSTVLVGCGLVAAAEPLPPSAKETPRPRPLVGAIRWDGWVGGGDAVGRAVHATLGPKKWHHRLPFFAQVLGDDGVEIDGTSQTVVDQEIEYAASAGLDYWAFVTYPEGSRLSLALDRYLSSRLRPRLRFCLITEIQRWRSPGFSQRVAGLMQEPGYQRVADGRPLLFLGFITAAKMEQFEGGTAGFQRILDELRQTITAAGRPTPYIVVMDFQPAEGAGWAAALGCDAISSYATGFEKRTIDYGTLAGNAERFWERCRDAGADVVPLVMTGWDRRPRVEHPHPWEPWQKPGEGMDRYVRQGTPAEIAGHLRRGLEWLEVHCADAPAQTVIIYAWNEFDEGGWLAPTLGEGSARLEAIARVLKPSAAREATATSPAPSGLAPGEP